MTAGEARRAISHHPAFAPMLALWLAALLGLAMLVLPDGVRLRLLEGAGLAALIPATGAGRMMASAIAALLGALAGFGLARALARMTARDPRPVYAEADFPDEIDDHAEPVRRPLRVREEVDEEQPEVGPPAGADAAAGGDPYRAAIGGAWNGAPVPPEAEEPVSILTPQPVHPPLLPEARGEGGNPDLASLLDRFDSALAMFRTGRAGDDRMAADGDAAPPDAVRAFLARQTGARDAAEDAPPPAAGPPPAPPGGLVPDHQAELRAALDKLARSHRRE